MFLLYLIQVRDLLRQAKRSEAGTGQLDNEPLTIYFVGGFFLLLGCC